MVNVNEWKGNVVADETNNQPGTRRVHKLTVDRNLCIGAASCVSLAPTVFELDNENKAVMAQADKKDSGPVERFKLKDQSIPDQQLIDAAQSCPTQAIFLHDETGKQIFP